jgi:hypothetical protein
MISSRYVLPVALALALALVPTVIHSYLGLLAEDGRSSRYINETLLGYTSESTQRKGKWVEDMFAGHDWVERIYRNREGREIRMFVARSYDHKKLYHHPELALSHGLGLGKSQIVRIDGPEGAPVFVLRGESGSGVVMYALHYDGEYIADPISRQIGNSLSLLFSERKPMTLFYISGDTTVPNENLENSDMGKLLISAVESFYSAPGMVTDNKRDNR